MEGQTSTEIRHGGEKHRKNPGSGLQGVGASEKGTNDNLARLEREDHVSQDEKARQKGIAAEDQLPESAEFVAGERQRHKGKPRTS